MEEWLPLADGGDATAQNSVGALYDHGLGVDEDDAAAAHWYELAAEQGLPLAMRNLANMYAGGHGVPFDKGLAESWYEKAARAGDPVSIKRMAALQPAGEFAAAAEAASVAEAVPAEPMTVAGDEAAAEAIPEAAAEAIPEAAPISEPAPAPLPAVAPEPELVAAAPAENAPPAAAPSDPGQPLQYGDTGTPAPEVTATAAPAATQQAAVTPPPAPGDPGNWLIGAWQGPSLGCPPNGGLEFAPGETRSYYGGQIAARLPATYQVAGDRVTVTSVGVDGVGSVYEYERRGADRFVIAAVPPEMPNSMVGVEHRRCGAAPKVSAAPAAPAKPAAAPAPEPLPQAAAPTPKPFVPEGPVAEAQPAPTPVPVPQVTEAPQPEPLADTEQAAAPASAPMGSAQDGWDAFGRGDYAGALAIWQPLAEQGDVPMQLLVGSIYDLGQGVPQDDVEAAKWYERAATRGSAKGQYQLGAIYARSPQAKDPFQGYKWLTIAARTLQGGPQDGITADQATTLRALIEGELSKDQIARAKAEAAAFKPGNG